MEYTFMIPRGKAEETERFDSPQNWRVGDYLLGLKQGGVVKDYRLGAPEGAQDDITIVAQLQLELYAGADGTDIISTLRERYGALTVEEYAGVWTFKEADYNPLLGRFGP